MYQLTVAEQFVQYKNNHSYEIRTFHCGGAISHLYPPPLALDRPSV